MGKIMAIYLTVIVSACLYLSRYSIGLASPDFKPGDCISWSYDEEFKVNTYNNLVLDVGKKYYLITPIHDGKFSDYKATTLIATTDGSDHLINCADVLDEDSYKLFKKKFDK